MRGDIAYDSMVHFRFKWHPKNDHLNFMSRKLYLTLGVLPSGFTLQEKWLFSNNSQPPNIISQITEAILGKFVLIWMHFSLWFQIEWWMSLSVNNFGIFTNICKIFDLSFAHACSLASPCEKVVVVLIFQILFHKLPKHNIRHVCTYLNAFCIVIPNRVKNINNFGMIFTNICDIFDLSSAHTCSLVGVNT